VSNAVTRTVTGRRSKWLALVVWLLVVMALGSLAGKLTGAEKNDASSWLPGSAESTKALDMQKAFQSPNTFDAVVIYSRDGALTAADRSKVIDDASRYADVGTLDGHVIGPIFSRDGKAAQVVVPLNLGHNGWNKAPKMTKKMRAIAETDPGLAVHITGPAGYAADSADAFKGIDGALLFAAVGVVIIILLFTYRSPILWLLPVICAGVALTASQGLIYLLAKHAGLTVNGQSAGILTVLVFGAGTDYALLLIARYREELRRHEDRHEAMALALHRAGPAIVASATTVVLGMLCLLAAEMNSTRGLGPVCALGVLVALLSMTTLLPALLVICGRWLFWPKRPHMGSEEPTSRGLWARTGRRIAARPRTVWVATALILGVLAVGCVDLNANGLTNAQGFRGHVDSVTGEKVVAQHFPAGAGAPVAVLSDASVAPAVRTAFARVPGIVDVTQPVVRGGVAYLQGTMQAAPDTSAGFATVDRVRAAVHPVSPSVKVGGQSAITLDVNRASKRDREIIIPIVLIVVLIVLALLLRAILAPVLLVLTVVLSFAAALGISSVIFRHVFGYPASDTSFPLFVFAFLVALGIDYNIFLMSRVREETIKHGTRLGAVTGLAATGGVITSAGLVLAGTFAVLATLPLVQFTEMGFAIALGVLLDTMVVRSVLVTAINLDLGDRIWWPSALSRRGDVGDELPAAGEPVSVV
jgi:RND superfamily putative drug exporter